MKGVDEWPRGRQQACSKEQDLGEQRLTRPLALGVLSPDGISSSAYGTEEILIALLPLAGLAAFTLILPMTLVILFVMVLVLLSYREIVMVYIRPGGSYVVARENFGPRIAQICAVALLIDYIVTVAVQTAAGTAAVASAFPSIGPYKLEITVGVVLLMAFGNLRGLREAGRAFAVPTYVFSGSRRPAALQPPAPSSSSWTASTWPRCATRGACGPPRSARCTSSSTASAPTSSGTSGPAPTAASRGPRSAATIVPYDVDSRVRVLQERQAAKAAAVTVDAAEPQVTSDEVDVAAKHSPAVPPPAEESPAKMRGLVREQGVANGQHPFKSHRESAAPAAVTPIGELTGPGRATVEGRIRVVEIKPVERNSVLACEISDGTGELTAMFYGRSHIPGLVCSARVRLRGSAGIRADGHPVMINPAYELLFPAV